MPKKIIAFCTAQSTPPSDFHSLTVLSRLPPATTNAVTAPVARAILGLDAKLQGLQERPKQNWTLRLNEVVTRLVRRDPALADALLRQPDFATPGHLALVNCLGTNRQAQAARLYLAAVERNARFPWSAPLIDLLAHLPGAQVRTLFRNELDHWQPKIFGEAARPMLGSFRSAETNIWQLAATVLKPQQQTELRQAIEARRQQNPLPEDVFATRALSFASQLAASGKEDPAKSGSLFSLLNLDPLSGLDPATREIAQARLFAERALYVTQKLPVILRWQTELLALNTMSMPPVQQLITNTTEIATSVERFSRMALPWQSDLL